MYADWVCVNEPSSTSSCAEQAWAQYQYNTKQVLQDSERVCGGGSRIGFRSRITRVPLLQSILRCRVSSDHHGLALFCPLWKIYWLSDCLCIRQARRGRYGATESWEDSSRHCQASMDQNENCSQVRSPNPLHSFAETQALIEGEDSHLLSEDLLVLPTICALAQQEEDVTNLLQIQPLGASGRQTWTKLHLASKFVREIHRAASNSCWHSSSESS